MGALEDHQDQEEMVLKVMMLYHITICHKRVETFNILQQLQEDMTRLDMGLVLLQGLRIMEEHLTQLEGILTILELLCHPHHTDHLVTIMVFPVATLEVNLQVDQQGEVQVVVVVDQTDQEDHMALVITLVEDRMEGLIGTLVLGLEDQHLLQGTLALGPEDQHLLQETLVVAPDLLLLLQIGSKRHSVSGGRYNGYVI